MPSSSRLTRTLAAGSILAGSVLGLTSLPSAGAAPTAEGTKALTWLAGEVVDADGLFEYDGGFGSFKDYGLTLDAVIALALGNAGDAAIDDVWDVFEADGSDYFAPDADRFAGSLAKTLLARELTGESTTVDGIDLEAELRARITASGDYAGRFRDLSGFGDFSNGFTQALGVLALNLTSGGAPADTVSYLLDQQCPGGGFRTAFDIDVDPPPFGDGVADPASTPGCTDAAESDPDSTALAVQALLTQTGNSDASAAVTAATAFLTANTGTNANTKGLVAQALRAAGNAAAADAIADDLADIQFPSGALSLTPATFAAGEAAATPQSLWRNTAQGVLAFGFGSIGVIPAPPATTSTTGATTSTTTATTSTSGASTSTTAAAAGSTTTTARSGAIPMTGSGAADQAGLAFVLIGIGAIVLGQAKLRDRRTP